jgi:hypothetical protein
MIVLRARASRRPGLFDVMMGAQLLERSTPAPFLDGCRRLLELGVDGNTVAVLRHVGAEVDSLRAKIGEAANLRVVTDKNGRPVFRRAIGGVKASLVQKDEPKAA